MISTLQTLTIFFKYSHTKTMTTRAIDIQRKREGLKEVGVGKVKLLCETKRLEKFLEMHKTILDCLTAISNHEGNKRSSKTMTVAFGLLCAISCSAFIAAFQVHLCMFEYVVCLSKLLQGSTQDVLHHRLQQAAPGIYAGCSPP